MKRFTILLLSLMPLGMYAQTPISIRTDFDVNYGEGDVRRKGETVIWEAKNFNEGDTYTTIGVWEDSNPQVVANPDKNGINKNDKCLKLTCSDTDGFFKMRLPSGFNLNGRRRISMLYKGMGKEFYAQLELVDEFPGGGSNNWKLGAYQDVDGWKRLYFDFTPYDEGTGDGYINVADEPDVLVFKPKIKDKNLAIQNSTTNDVYYIDEIKVEDVPYAEGYWINDNDDNGVNVNLPKGTMKDGKWNTVDCQLPKGETNGVLHLSGTWLKGRNIVNPDCTNANTETDPKNIAGYWIYEFNEYRDLSWHVKPEEVKLMVFHKDAKLRWPDRGGLLGTNTGTPEATQGYPDRFIKNLNVLIFAEKSCILPDEVNNLAANWYDTNAVVHYGNNVWEAWELELTDEYGFVNPLQFTALNLIKVHRSMKAGFNALIYPFELTPAELKCARVGTVYHHRDPGTEGLLYFVPAPKTEPNVPYLTEYLASSEDATSKVAYDYQEFKNDNHIVYPVQEDYEYKYDNDAILYGNYVKDFSGDGKWGLVTTDTWQGFMKGEGEDAKFKPFRGYLKNLPAADVSGARMLSIFDADDTDVTGIETPGLPFKAETLKTIYDMQGRVIKGSSIATLSKGIYIINGKKTVIK